MKLGLNIGMLTRDVAGIETLVRRADEVGIDSVWSSEAWGADAATVLAYLAAKTERIKLATAIMQIPGRTPANAAMTAMALDLLSDGRVVLGLGLSGPQVVEGWHGVPYGKPLARTREYVDIIRAIVARDEPVVYEGSEYQVPYTGPGASGLGKPLRSMIHPIRTEIPIYLAALGPKNVRQTAEIADGWLPIFYSPEREDPGNAQFTTHTIPKLVGGHTPACLDVGKALYSGVIDRVVPVSSTRAAEMTKLLENIHRAVNIGLVNEMKIVADRMGIDVFEVIDAAATKPFGFTPYYPGPGLGGHCIPVDPFYLTWKAREYGLHTRFIELSGEINRAMPEYVVGKLVKALNERRKSLNGSRVLVLGVAYKKNVDDMRESPSVEVMELLQASGAEVAYSDPHVPVFPPMRAHSFDLESVPLNAATLAGFDAVVLATDHARFDYDLIREHAALIVDSRGVWRDAAPNIVRA